VTRERRTDWQTPRWLFDALNREFAFDVDAAADRYNRKTDRFFGPGSEHDDALAAPWTGSVFVNPPFGTRLADWVRKGLESAAAGATVTMIVPARVESEWWTWCVARATGIRFIRGRVHYELAGRRTRNSRPSFATVVLVLTPAGGPPLLSTMAQPRRAARQMEFA